MLGRQTKRCDNILTGHFIRCTFFLLLAWAPVDIQNCLSNLWHRFNKLMESFIRVFGPYLVHIDLSALHPQDESLACFTTFKRFSIGL